MEEGQIVKAVLLQADGEQKERPVLLLKQFPPYKDWLVAGISSKLHQRSELDILLETEHPDFSQTGLKKPGAIRLGFLGMVPEQQIPGAIGSVTAQTHQELIERLVDHLKS